jgi:hypothetical protein
MVERFLHIGAALCVLLAGSQLAGAAVANAEDLTGCKLQNGRVVLPVAGTPGGTNGHMYKFSTNTYIAAPSAGGGAVTPDEALALVREAKSADVQYLPEKNGALWAFSGAISEVPGALYLADVRGWKLDAPWPIPKTTQNLAGECQNIMEGGVYLLKTTDGRYVVLRVLEKSATSAVIQYVYQADGGLAFDVPANVKVAYQHLAEAPPPSTPTPTPAPAASAEPATVPAANFAGGRSSTASASVGLNLNPTLPWGNAAAAASPSIVLPATGPAAAGVLVPAIKTPLGPGDINEGGVIRLVSGAQAAPVADPALANFVRERAQLLQRRLEIIAAPARTPAELDRKSQAVNELLVLHGDDAEAADLLVAEISFFNPRGSDKDFSPDALHPCYAALKHMGKAATAAALKGLGKLDLGGPGEGIDSAMYKAKLLGMVVRGVEGDDVAEMLFKRAAEKAGEGKGRAVFEMIGAK